MYALCLESSHLRGMGHLFRGLNLYFFLKKNDEEVIILINDDEPAISVLEKELAVYEIVDFEDTHSDWESKLVQKHGVNVWINDKYQTKRELYMHVKNNRAVILVAIDEESENSDLLDIHFVGMVFQKDFVPKGKNIFCGVEYVILNEEIRKYRRVRTCVNRVIVSMGGSDTYGVTIKILEILKKKKICADIVVGPSFEHWQELRKHLTIDYSVLQNVPSLVRRFSGYDLAVTGGGVTCFEAAASGLPCIVVANESFEIDTAKYMENLGAVVFAGHHEQIDENLFLIDKLDIERMSRQGMQNIPLDGVRNIYQKIREYIVGMEHE